jgi:hypothetical protein
MAHNSLADSVLVTQELGPATAASGAKNGTGVDMQGWDGVMFVVNTGAITGAGVLDGRAEMDDNSGFNTPTNVSGVNATGSTLNAALTQISNANGVAIIDVYRPSERYVRAVLTPAVNSVLYSCVAVRYRRAGVLPPTQSATEVVRVRAN